MGLVGPWLSTTNTKKRKETVTKAQQEQFERDWRERNIRLKQMGLPKETLEQFMEWVRGKGKKTKSSKDFSVQDKAPCPKVEATRTQEKTVASKISEGGAWTMGATAKKQSQVYTGTKVIGIATMHKSNPVPVFSDDEAKDISKMRR
jgi:hypothetical protein